MAARRSAPERSRHERAGLPAAGEEKVGIPVMDAYPMPGAADLPRNTAQWQPDARRAVLLIHDMQRYFVRRVPADNPQRALISNIRRLRQACLELGVPVGYTAQPGGMSKQQRGLLHDFWGAGMQVDAADRAFIDALAPGPDDWLFTKWRYSAFFRSGLLERMRHADRDQLVICGVYGHIGILATAVEAFSNDIQTFLAADAVADFSARHHGMTLTYAAACCAVVATSERITTQLQSSTMAERELIP